MKINTILFVHMRETSIKYHSFCLLHLTFPLLAEKKTIPYIILLIIWNLGILSGLLSFILGGEIKFNFFLCVFLISFFIWIVGNFFIKKYKIIGNIEISSNTIKIVNTNNVFNINVVETNGLILKYLGAKGDSFGAYAGFFRANDGSGNLISFEYEGKSYEFKFLVTQKHFLNTIYWILKTWRDNNIDFKILNQKKENITSKVLNRQGRY